MNRILKHIYILIIFSGLLFSQRLITEVNKFDKLKIEYDAISSNKITNDLFFSPYIQKKPSNKIVSLGYKHYFQIEPTFALRLSNHSFEMFSKSIIWDQDNEFAETVLNNEVNKSMLWISPGIKIHSTIPIFRDYTNIWMYNWSTFYKHSAYGFGGLQSWVDKDTPLFSYNNEYSIEYYEPTQSPDNGLDFDEGQSGISLLSNNFELILGKFQTNIGPFYSGNLSISDNSPSFTQFLAKVNFDNKIYFSYLLGSLTSYVGKSNEAYIYMDQWDEQVPSGLYGDYISDISEPMVNRYVVNHRFDFLPNENFRIGLYEQIIFGGDSFPVSYLIPLNPLFSAQHATNDQDNLQIGLDLDYINNNNRFSFALMMDEWALYDTFKKTERNWFAYQLGYSRLLSLFDIKTLVKIEYSYVDPGAYTHRFIINEPKHHGYNLGYWSDSNSDDFTFNTTLFLKNNSILLFEYKYTRFGQGNELDLLEQQYTNELGVDHLGEGYTSKNDLSIMFSKLLKNNLFIDLEYSRLNYINKIYFITTMSNYHQFLLPLSANSIIDGTANHIYEFSSEKIHDVRIKLRYNISK